jgi:hypothetical protein
MLFLNVEEYLFGKSLLGFVKVEVWLVSHRLLPGKAYFGRFEKFFSKVIFKPSTNSSAVFFS